MKQVSNIKNVAEVAKVSISTVSRVLNNSANVSEALKQRVYQAIEETKYSVNPIASTLKSARRNQIAIVLPSLRQTYYTDIIKGASDYCCTRGVMPVILESGGDDGKEKQIIKDLEKQWVDGILFIPGKNAGFPGYRNFIHSLNALRKQESHIPVVLVESCGLSRSLDCVRVNYEQAFYEMTCHLLEIGRNHPAFLSSPPCSPVYDACRTSFCKAICDRGGRPDENRIEHADYTILAGYQAMQRLLERDDTIDGVVCCNDQVAAGALHACRERGPQFAEKIAIVGFGGVAMSIITTPSITTVVSPRYDIGHTAAKVLFERIEGSTKPPEERILPSHMAVRESTLRTAFKDLERMFSE